MALEMLSARPLLLGLFGVMVMLTDMVAMMWVMWCLIHVMVHVVMAVMPTGSASGATEGMLPVDQITGRGIDGAGNRDRLVVLCLSTTPIH